MNEKIEIQLRVVNFLGVGFKVDSSVAEPQPDGRYPEGRRWFVLARFLSDSLMHDDDVYYYDC